MKKIITIYFFVFNILFVFSQDQASVTLNWTEKKELAYGKTSYNIPQFDILNLQFDSYARTLKYSSRVKLNGLANEKGLQLSNIIYEPILESQLGDLAVKEIPTSLKYSFKNIIARDIYFGQITISPIIKEGNSFKKLISFSYSISQKPPNSVQKSSNNVSSVENSVLITGKW